MSEAGFLKAQKKQAEDLVAQGDPQKVVFEWRERKPKRTFTATEIQMISEKVVKEFKDRRTELPTATDAQCRKAIIRKAKMEGDEDLIAFAFICDHIFEMLTNRNSDVEFVFETLDLYNILAVQEAEGKRTDEECREIIKQWEKKHPRAKKCVPDVVPVTQEAKPAAMPSAPEAKPVADQLMDTKSDAVASAVEKP